MKEGLKNFFHINKNGRGLVTFLGLVIFLGISGALTACNVAEAEPDIKVSVLLQDLTETEYLHVGTAEIENPVIDDFKKLIVRLDARGLENRNIRFPSIRDIDDLLTGDVVWFGSSESTDNPSEDVAYYLLETTLYTRNITAEEIRKKLSALNIDISYTDKQGDKVEKHYNVGDCLAANALNGGLSQEGSRQGEKFNRLIAGRFPETGTAQQGKLLLTTDIPQDHLLLALILSQAKMGQSFIHLLALEQDLNIIAEAEVEVPLSPCYTVHTIQVRGYTVTFGATDDTKWLGDSDQVVPVDIRKVRAVYSDGTEISSMVQNNGYICYTQGTITLTGLYFYSDDGKLQADHSESYGWGLGNNNGLAAFGAPTAKSGAASVVQRHLEALANNHYEAWKSTLWPAKKNEQNFTPTFEKPGDLGVISLSVEKAEVSDEATQQMIERYAGCELAQSYNWSDQYIMENMIVVYARYTVDYDNKKVPYNEGTMDKNFILIRDDENSPWLIWDSGHAMQVDLGQEDFVAVPAEDGSLIVEKTGKLSRRLCWSAKRSAVMPTASMRFGLTAGTKKKQGSFS